MRRFLTAMVCLITIFSIGGVYATWQYAAYNAADAETQIGASLSTFDYPPEQILPGGDVEDAELGEDHYGLIDRILNEDNKNYGLNLSTNNVLHKYLKDDGYVFSNQKVSGGNLKFILDVKYNTYGLYYCLEYISATEYYCYTFETDDLSTVGGSTTEIVAYRTILVKTDKWRATTSYKGYALTKRVDAMGASADSNSIRYSIDMSTWHM